MIGSPWFGALLTTDQGSRQGYEKPLFLRHSYLLNDLVKASFFKAMWTNWWWSPFSMQVVNKKRGICFPREVSNISGRLLYIPTYCSALQKRRGFLPTQQLYRHDQSSTVAGLSQQCFNGQEQSRLKRMERSTDLKSFSQKCWCQYHSALLKLFTWNKLPLYVLLKCTAPLFLTYLTFQKIWKCDNFTNAQFLVLFE